MNDEVLELFREYLLSERQALLTRLDKIERLLGTSPRTAEIRKWNKSDVSGNVAGVLKYDG